jgi:hypothetical protein
MKVYIPSADHHAANERILCLCDMMLSSAVWLNWLAKLVSVKLQLSLENMGNEQVEIVTSDVTLKSCERSTELAISISLDWIPVISIQSSILNSKDAVVKRKQSSHCKGKMAKGNEREASNNKRKACEVEVIAVHIVLLHYCTKDNY